MLTRYMPTPRLLYPLMLALALLGVGVAPLLSQGTGGVAHGEGELIERVRAEGDGNFTVVRTAPSGAETQGYGGGLLIRVKDANGNPVTSGRVEVFDSPDSRDFSGSLGQSGEVFADVPDGTYTVIVSSFSPLFVVREGVQAPGTVDIDPEGTIAVSFQALDLDQNPINGYVVPRPGYRTTGSIGFTGSSGSPLDALITPRLYDAFIAWSWSDLYYLFLADRDINGTIGADLGVNGATDLTFSAALVDTGTLTIVDTPGFDGLSVTPFNQTNSQRLPRPHSRAGGRGYGSASGRLL